MDAFKTSAVRQKILTITVLVTAFYTLTFWLVTSSVYIFIDYSHAVRCYRNLLLADASTPGVWRHTLQST